MVFSSIFFLCCFLPCVYVIYCVIPNIHVRNAVLIIASLVFYAYGEPVYIFLLLISWLFNYIFARFIDNAKSGKALLVIDIIFNIALLVVFKYSGFIISNLNSIFGGTLRIPEWNLAMPIGISFYTFQTLSYVIDVYRGNVGVQKNAFKLLLYISFFPQLIAGPIVKYRDISEEIDNRHITLDDASYGIRRFIIGLAKKVLIADSMAAIADGIFAGNPGQINILAAWLGAIAYMMQIYYDFSGYSDMAIGMGRMFGFHFKENFNYPYVAGGMKDFWRRWHISLTDWFREYVYIPMGGNRKGKARTSFNKIIVFLLTGFWHGANWTFLAWGAYHAIFQLLEDYVPKIRKMPKVLLHIYTLIVVCVGFVIFRADNIVQGGFMISRMFSGFTFGSVQTSFILGFLDPWSITMMIVAILGCGLIQYLIRKVSVKDKFRAVSVALTVVLLALCIFQLAGSTYHPFIYFRF